MKIKNIAAVMDEIIDYNGDTGERYGFLQEIKGTLIPLGQIGWVIVVVLALYWTTKYFMAGGVLLYLALLAYTIFKISIYNKDTKLNLNDYTGPMP